MKKEINLRKKCEKPVHKSLKKVWMNNSGSYLFL
jgi:hypothetical protein